MSTDSGLGRVELKVIKLTKLQCVQKPLVSFKSGTLHVKDVVPTKRCGNAPKEIAISKQLQTHLKQTVKSCGNAVRAFPPHYTSALQEPVPESRFGHQRMKEIAKVFGFC